MPYPSEILKGHAKEKTLTSALYAIAQLRYVSWAHLKSCKKTTWQQHIFTEDFLQKLVDCNILEQGDFPVKPIPKKHRVYRFTSNLLGLLKEYQELLKPPQNIELLQSRGRGKPKEHTLAITSHILNVKYSDETFYSVFYPEFFQRKLRPDACLVFKLDEKYRIEFIEIERTLKTDPDYLKNKQRGYKRLSEDPATYYEWWEGGKEIRKKLRLSYCDIEKFKFVVSIKSKNKEEWGTGFVWKE